MVPSRNLFFAAFALFVGFLSGGISIYFVTTEKEPSKSTSANSFSRIQCQKPPAASPPPPRFYSSKSYSPYLEKQELDQNGVQDSFSENKKDSGSSFDEGIAAFTSGDRYKAQQIWEQALSRNPTDIEILQSLSMAYEASGRYQEFVAKYKSIIQTSPDSISLYSDLASSLNAHSQTSEARQILEEGVANNPDDPEFYYLLADHLAENGDFKGAVKHYQDALSIKPNDPWAHFFLGQIYLKAHAALNAQQEFDIASQQSVEVAAEIEEFQRQFEYSGS